MAAPIGRWALAGTAALALACAATTPSPPAAQETLVVLNAGDATLTLLTLDGGGAPQIIPLGNIGAVPRLLAVRDSQGLITTLANTVARVGLTVGQSPVVYHVANGAGTWGAAFVNDTIAYVANPLVDRATRFNFRTGDTASVAVGHTPTAVAVTRGRVFIANANLDLPCAGPLPCVHGPSWLTVIDPDHNTVIDSIPLAGPGNAIAIEIGGDGLLYVLSAGGGGAESGRLSIVDPVLRADVGSFGGFGPLPVDLATDHRERMFVISATGLMEFNTRTRRVVRGSTAAIPLQQGSAVAVDDEGLIYAIESGLCSGSAVGRIRVFRPDLTEARIVAAGVCPVDAAIVKLPPPPE